MLKALSTATVAIALILAYFLGSGMTLMAIRLHGTQQTHPSVWFQILDIAGVAAILIMAVIIFLMPFVLLFDMYRNPCRYEHKG